MIVRHADENVLGFESKSDVDRFVEDIKVRFAQFGLTLSEHKTRVLQFGRFVTRAPSKELQSRRCQLPRIHPHLWHVLVERLVLAEAG
jgi:RNA-directed DNA polymerase